MSMNMKKINLTYIILLVIIILAFGLRVYKLDTIPSSLNWDEISAGYNAWAIANYARDDSGEVMPLVFRSFLDDKHPVHIYTTAIFVKLFGLNDFIARLPAALAGVGCVIVMFLLGRIWFNSTVGLFAAFFLSIAPYNIHFSRGLWETNFALLFFMLGIYCFYQGLARKSFWFTASFVSFGLSAMSYHSSKVLVPAIVLLLLILYIKQLIKIGWSFYLSLIVILVFIAFFVADPRLLDLARATQNRFSSEQIHNTSLYKSSSNELLGLSEIVYVNYLKHYDINYLFIKGDQSPRNSTKVFGQFYWLDLIFAILGAMILLYKRSRVTLVIFAWILLAPIPSSMVQGAPQATRALFMMGSVQMLCALAAGTLVTKIINTKLKVIVAVLIVGIYLYSLSLYLNIYFNQFAKKEGVDWQYGMKQIVEYVKDNPDYARVYMTEERSQPYIFFLYYLKYPLPDFLRWVEYNPESSVSHNLVSSFDKYNFGNWNELESRPDPGVLYIVTPSQYDGLQHKPSFDVKKRIQFPGGGDAFFIISAMP